MAVMTGKIAVRHTVRLAALVLGTAVVTLPGVALAQQDDHHGREGGAQQQQPARPAPAPAPRAAPPPRGAPQAAPMEHGGNWRGAGGWAGQARPGPGNPAGNGGQPRPPQQNLAPGQMQPPYRGQAQYQGQPRQGQAHQDQPAFQGRPDGNDAGRGNRDQGRNDGGQWRGNGGPGHNDGGRYDSARRDGGRNDGQWRGGPRGAGEWNHGWRQDQRYDWRGYREANRDAFHANRYYPPYRDYNYDRLGVGFYLQPLFFGSDYWIADPWDYRLPPAYGPYHWVRYYNDVILVNTYTGQVADVIYDFFW